MKLMSLARELCQIERNLTLLRDGRTSENDPLEKICGKKFVEMHQVQVNTKEKGRGRREEGRRGYINKS